MQPASVRPSTATCFCAMEISFAPWLCTQGRPCRFAASCSICATIPELRSTALPRLNGLSSFPTSGPTVLHPEKRPYRSSRRSRGCSDPYDGANAQGGRAHRRNYPGIAKRCGHSLTSRSSWCRTSPPRSSSPLRTRGYSASCVNPSSSRRRPPTCSRSSVDRRSICKRCSIRW